MVDNRFRITTPKNNARASLKTVQSESDLGDQEKLKKKKKITDIKEEKTVKTLPSLIGKLKKK